MGKAQSKRSVDITTEVKKDDVPEEGTGKMGKIEDVDQLKPQVNGDTHHNENNDAADKEKSAEVEATENEKDLSTEKEKAPAEPKPVKPEGGDEATAVTTPTAGDKPVENGDQDETLNESKNAADTSTVENGDSSKKPKKEKVKKKWSIRSISFGKKDKQKPPKKEEPATNGECEKVPEEATTDDAAKNGKATAEEATAATSPSDVKSPAATSPTTAETKEVAPVAAAVAAATTEVAAPVVNGSSEPAKDEKPVAEVAPTIVAEEKTPEKAESSAVVEEPPKVETPPVVVESSPAPEPVKTEETPAPPAKIEVKAESIQDENIENKLEAAQVVSDSPQQGDIDKMENKIDENVKNIDGDSESAQNLPPPPLPCTSPPSQVSVFALSDVNKDNVEDEQSLVPPPVELESSAVEAVPELKDDSIPEPVVALAAADLKPDEIPPENQEVIEKVVDEPAIVPVVAETSAEPPTTAATVVETVVATPEQTGSQTTDSSSEIAPPKEENAKPEEAAIEETIAAALASTPPSESSPVNQEKIAETIALIDEVTKTAAVSVSNQLESPVPIESPVETSEPVAQEQQAPSDNVEFKLPSPIIPTHPEEDKPAAPEQSPVFESSVPVEDPSLPKEQESSITQSLPDALQAPNTETKESRTEHIGDHGENAQSTPIEEPIVNTDVPVEKIPVEDEAVKLSTNPPTVACETDEAAAQVAKTKENGFGDNHATETSATESLNGVVDHKAIEEIKTDCSEKLIGEPTTELAVATVEVKE